MIAYYQTGELHSEIAIAINPEPAALIAQAKDASTAEDGLIVIAGESLNGSQKSDSAAIFAFNGSVFFQNILGEVSTKSGSKGATAARA